MINRVILKSRVAMLNNDIFFSQILWDERRVTLRTRFWWTLLRLNVSLGQDSERFEAQEESPIKKHFLKHRSPMSQVRKVQVNRSLKIKVVLEWKLRYLPTESVAKVNWLINWQVKYILYEFDQVLNKTKKIRKLENLRRWKIKKEHIAWLQHFWITNK